MDNDFTVPSFSSFYIRLHVILSLLNLANVWQMCDTNSLWLHGRMSVSPNPACFAMSLCTVRWSCVIGQSWQSTLPLYWLPHSHSYSLYVNRSISHRLSQEFVLEHSWGMKGRCKLPQRGSGKKIRNVSKCLRILGVVASQCHPPAIGPYACVTL